MSHVSNDIASGHPPLKISFPKKLGKMKFVSQICTDSGRVIYRQMADNYSAQYFMFNEGIAVATQIFIRLFLSVEIHEDEHASARKRRGTAQSLLNE
jgi:hypothetical protein